MFLTYTERSFLKQRQNNGLFLATVRKYARPGTYKGPISKLWTRLRTGSC